MDLSSAGMARIPGSRSGLSARGRTLPVVVASGLAIGVFAGLVVVRGTGEAAGEVNAASGPVAPPAHKVVSAPADAAASGAASPDAGAVGAPGSQPGGSRLPAAGTPSGSAPGLASPPAGPAATVSFEVRPKGAVVTVDGQWLSGATTQVALTGGRARIQVSVKARGHRSHTKSYAVTGDRTIEVSLRRDRRGTSPTGPGGLLDIK